MKRVFRGKLGLMFYFEIGLKRDESKSAAAKALDEVLTEVRRIMSQIDDLKAAVAEQTSAITDMQARVESDVNELQDKISQLEGGDSPELTGLLDSIKANTAAVNTLDPVVTPLPDGGEVTPPTDGGTDTPPVDDQPAPTEEPAPTEPAPTEPAPAEEVPAAPAEGDQSAPAEEETPPQA